METLTQHVIEQIENMSSDELMDLNNAYCKSCNIDSEIYVNDEEFFETYFDGRAIEAVKAAHFGDYNFSHEYVQFNGYGNLDSYSSLDSSDICELVSVIAEYAIENQSDFDMLDFDFEETEDAE